MKDNTIITIIVLLCYFDLGKIKRQYNNYNNWYVWQDRVPNCTINRMILHSLSITSFFCLFVCFSNGQKRLDLRCYWKSPQFGVNREGCENVACAWVLESSEIPLTRVGFARSWGWLKYYEFLLCFFFIYYYLH
jgi:hypothetical protein